MTRLTLTTETTTVTAAIDTYEAATAAWLADPTTERHEAVQAAWNAQQDAMNAAKTA